MHRRCTTHHTPHTTHHTPRATRHASRTRDQAPALAPRPGPRPKCSCAEGCRRAGILTIAVLTVGRGVAELGQKWTAIAKRLPGRAPSAVRYRWYRLAEARPALTLATALAQSKPRPQP